MRNSVEHKAKPLGESFQSWCGFGVLGGVALAWIFGTREERLKKPFEIHTSFRNKIHAVFDGNPRRIRAVKTNNGREFSPTLVATVLALSGVVFWSFGLKDSRKMPSVRRENVEWTKVLAICHWEIKGRFRKRVVLANVPSFRFSFRGNIRRNHPFGNHPFVNTEKAHWEIKGRFPKGWFRRMYPRSCFRSGGTSAKTTLLETALLRTPEFGQRNPWMSACASALLRGLGWLAPWSNQNLPEPQNLSWRLSLRVRVSNSSGGSQA